MEEFEPIDIQHDSLNGLLSRYVRTLKHEILDLSHKNAKLTKEGQKHQVMQQRYLLQIDKKELDLQFAKEKMFEGEGSLETLRRERDAAISAAKDSAVSLTRISADYENKNSQVKTCLLSFPD